MKYIILILVLFSCAKQEVKMQRHEVVDYMEIPTGKPGKGNGHGNNTPPPPPAPAPIPTTGVKCIYVDFDGEQINSTYWGAFYARPSLLTAAQRAEVLNYSSAHYAAYKVTVTSNRYIYDTTALSKKVMIVVTDSAIRTGSTGVALMGTFGTSEQIAWVFSANLGNISKYVGDIVSHEAGHTLGLYHQTVCTDGVITNQWRDGAIMGYPYYTNPAQWVTGTVYSCTVTQNDHQILSAKLGLK